MPAELVWKRSMMAPLSLLYGINIVFTTDSHAVRPIFFPGGDIGRISICGTVNDLAMMGGRPLALSCGMIIEEGFEDPTSSGSSGR